MSIVDEITRNQAQLAQAKQLARRQALRMTWPKGKFVVVQLEDRQLFNGAHRRGEISVFGAVEELALSNACELRDGLMVRGWPAGLPNVCSPSMDEHPLQGLVLHACGSRAEAERWLAEFLTRFQPVGAFPK